MIMKHFAFGVFLSGVITYVTVHMPQHSTTNGNTHTSSRICNLSFQVRLSFSVRFNGERAHTHTHEVSRQRIKKGDKHLIEGVTGNRLLDPLRCFIFRSMDMDMGTTFGRNNGYQ